MGKKVYLANPYGFSKQQRRLLLPEICNRLESMGLEVWEPFKRNNNVSFKDPEWPFNVGNKNIWDIKNSDGTVAIVNGTPPDEGVCVEIGVAIACGKPTFLFRDDKRRCTDNVKYPLNLMLFLGLPRDEWFKYYYSSVNELTSRDKALYRFSKQLETTKGLLDV